MYPCLAVRVPLLSRHIPRDRYQAREANVKYTHGFVVRGGTVQPFIAVFALRAITAGDELLADYEVKRHWILSLRVCQH